MVRVGFQAKPVNEAWKTFPYVDMYRVLRIAGRSPIRAPKALIGLTSPESKQLNIAGLRGDAEVLNGNDVLLQWSCAQ